VATTEFKPIGVTLDVSPRVTHLNDIIANISAKQSSVSGLTDTGVPIEDKREAETTLTVKDGQTIFIGGLRNHADRLEVSKVPVLGDVPVINFLFRNTRSEKTNTELMVFLTCHVLGDRCCRILRPASRKPTTSSDSLPRGAGFAAGACSVRWRSLASMRDPDVEMAPGEVSRARG
jgi:type II secretory pathway component GspD/PulD (secretin)